MFDFPNAPTNGQQVQGSAGQLYAWDGAKWAAQMPPGPLPISSGGTGVNNAAAAPWVETAGDVMSGNLTIGASDPGIILNKSASGKIDYIQGNTNGSARWFMMLGDEAAESATAVGSNFAINRYDNTGAFINQPFAINRSTGLTTFAADAPTLSLVPVATNYTSIMFRRNNGNADQHRWEIFSSDAGDLQIRTINDGYSAADAGLMIKRAASGVGIGEVSTNGTDFIARHMTIRPSSGSADLALNGTSCGIYGFQAANGQGRWLLQLGNGAAETGGTVGSNLQIHRYDDNGVYINAPFTIWRNSGQVDIPSYTLLGGMVNNPLEIRGVTSGEARIKYHVPAIRIWMMGPVGAWGSADFYLTDESAGSVGRLAVTGGAGVCWCTNGTWNSLSDIATKKPESIQPYERGLADLVQLRPISFEYNGELGSADDGEQRYGLIAQEVEPHFPECISHLAFEDTQVKGVDNGRLIYAVINALKEVQTRLQALEAR